MWLMHQIGLIAETSNDWKVVKVHQDSEIPITPNVNPILGAEIVGRIKRFEPLMEIIRHQDELYDGTGSRIIYVVSKFRLVRGS